MKGRRSGEGVRGGEFGKLWGKVVEEKSCEMENQKILGVSYTKLKLPIRVEETAEK